MFEDRTAKTLLKYSNCKKRIVLYRFANEVDYIVCDESRTGQDRPDRTERDRRAKSCVVLAYSLL